MGGGPTGTYSENVIESRPQLCWCDIHSSVTFTTLANITTIILSPTTIAEKLLDEVRCLHDGT